MPGAAPPPAYTPTPGYAPAPAGYAPPPGYATPAPAPAKKKTGLIVGIVIALLVALGVCGAVAAFFLLPKMAAPTTATSTTPTKTVEPTKTAEPTNAENTAVEQLVVRWYEDINAGNYDSVKAAVAPDRQADMDPGMFEGWSKTTFEIARSVVDGDSANVWGRESQRMFGSEDRGVKFTLGRVEDGTWRIVTWTGVDEAAVNGAKIESGQGAGDSTSLDEASARDAVTKILEARRTGKSNIVRQYTTANFQKNNGDIWLDGSDNSEFFLSFAITGAKSQGDAYLVTVREEWNSGAETATYAVIERNGAVLVDSWETKQ
ncbi:MAG: hypothetical protein Q7W30_06615 [Coriobacteriia bacterium]|nr:hypothetical protein [Coriobacteriia bacterium]